MKITKYEHACLDIEENGKHLIIDPGKFSISYHPTADIEAVVITHMHSDHFDPSKIREILSVNPEAIIFAPKQVSERSDGLVIEYVVHDSGINIGEFRLEFCGGDHELYEDTQNIGVIVNGTLYYPGDSYSPPCKPITILAAPASAPWLRVPDAATFIKDTKPQKVFPMHNAVLSEIGESIHYPILANAASEVGCEWLVLKPGESLVT